MLRININDGPEEQRWFLQGRLTASSVGEVQGLWDKSRSSLDTRRWIVDLTDVTAIDACGEELLHAMRSAGAEFIASGVYTKHVVDVIDDECRSKRKDEQFAADKELAGPVARQRLGRKS